MSNFFSEISKKFCGGSSRRMIAGWWYTILAMTGIMALMAVFIMGSKGFSEGFVSFWSAAMLFALSIGGTMIMRKFHNSMAVGFFMGGVIAMAQMYFFLSLVYIGFMKENKYNGESGYKEWLMFLLSFFQAFLLASFAAILGVHRSELLGEEGETDEKFETPYVQQ